MAGEGYPGPAPAMSAAQLLYRLTGAATLAIGAMLYGDGDASLATLSIGAANTVMTSSGTAPQWSTSLALTGTIASKQAAAAGISLDHNSATGNFTLRLSPANITANRRWSFADKDDTVAGLTAQTFTGIQTFTLAPVMTALTASRLVRTDAGKALESNAALTATGVLFADANGWPSTSANFTFTTTVCTIANTTNASNATTGAFVVGNGTSATSVAIGGGNIYCGGAANRFAAGNVAASGTVLQVTKGSLATSGNDWAILAVTTVAPGSASTQNASGLAGNVSIASGASGISGSLTGLDGAIDADATANTFASTTALFGRFRKGGACTITTATAVGASLSTSAAGTITAAHGFYLDTFANSGGATITTAYGLRIASITVGSTNYAIHTSSGLVSFGDTTDATSSTAASVTLGGGLAVAKKIYAGTDINAGSALYAGALVQAGTGAASSSINVISDGGASGTAAGATIYIRNGGATVLGFGNYSAMFGGAYDATPAIYAVAEIRCEAAIKINGATLTLADATNLVVNTTTGTKIGTATTQKLSLWNATPIVQPSSTGETTGWTTGGGSAATSTDTYTGNVGTKAYTVNDVVKHLKNIGALAAS